MSVETIAKNMSDSLGVAYYSRIFFRIHQKTTEVMCDNIKNNRNEDESIEAILQGINSEMPLDAKFDRGELDYAKKLMKDPSDSMHYKTAEKNFKERAIFGVDKTTLQQTKAIAGIVTRFIAGFFATAGLAIGAAISTAGYVAGAIPIVGTILRHAPGSSEKTDEEKEKSPVVLAMEAGAPLTPLYNTTMNAAQDLHEGDLKKRKNVIRNIGDMIIKHSAKFTDQLIQKQAPVARMLSKPAGTMVEKISAIDPTQQWLRGK